MGLESLDDRMDPLSHTRWEWPQWRPWYLGNRWSRWLWCPDCNSSSVDGDDDVDSVTVFVTGVGIKMNGQSTSRGSNRLGLNWNRQFLQTPYTERRMDRRSPLIFSHSYPDFRLSVYRLEPRFPDICLIFSIKDRFTSLVSLFCSFRVGNVRSCFGLLWLYWLWLHWLISLTFYGEIPVVSSFIIF